MKRKKKINNILVHLFLSVLAIIWVSPLFWIILTSFRAQKGAYTSSFFPKKYTFDNYIKLFTDTGILNFPRMFSLMSQYTPFWKAKDIPRLNRRITTFEYRKALDAVYEAGLDGFMQERSSAREEYTPDFDLSGI